MSRSEKLGSPNGRLTKASLHLGNTFISPLKCKEIHRHLCINTYGKNLNHELIQEGSYFAALRFHGFTHHPFKKRGGSSPVVRADQLVAKVHARAMHRIPRKHANRFA